MPVYLDANGNPIPSQQGASAAPAKVYLDPNTGEPLAAPQHDFSTLTANPKGEGTYKITTGDGQTLAVPYSNVPVFTQGLQGASFATPGEQARFAKDAAADPQRPTFWNALTNPVGSGFWNALTNPVGSGRQEQGVGGGALQVGGQAIKTMAQPLAHPIDTIEGMAKTAGDAAIYGPAGVAQDVIVPVAQQYAQDKQQGGNALALENLAGQVLGTLEGGRVMGAAASAAKPALAAAGAAGKGFLTGDVNAPMPGTDLTPAVRYESMRAMGLQPNAAEATNSRPLNMVEKVNQNSLTAAPSYADARQQNLTALNGYAKDVLDSMSEKAPEAGGAAVQQGLRDAQTKLQNDAAEGFSTLDRAVGNRKMSGVTLQQTAKNIYDANADYYAQHPALVPGNAWKIVKDLAGADATPPFQSRPMGFPEVHQLRSDLLELVRSNPDIVKNQAGGWLQQLANAADHTMTTGATGLNEQGTQIFRDANQAWADMKGTYDNPSHPFYQAVRTPSPSTLVKGIQQTPEMAKALQAALGPEGIGPIQRGVAENLLKTTKDGGYNFKTFQGQWNKLPQAYRDALFTPEQISQLNDIGNAGTVLQEDANPSGSARLGQGIAEGAEALRSVPSLHEMAGNAAYHGVQYGLGKLMNNPGFVDWLMRGRGFAPIGDTGRASALPAAAGSAAVWSADPHTGPLGQPNFYSDDYLRAKAAFDPRSSR